MSYRDQSLPIKKRVSDLLSQMNVTEKISQIGSCFYYDLQTNGQLDMDKANGRLKNGIGQITRLGGASTLTPVELAKTANLLQKSLVEKTRLGIPAIIHDECCSGALSLGGSIFPQMIGLAGTFQPDLAEKMTAEIRQQLRAVGIHQGLAPVLDVARDPRWGRVEETFGEDPLLISQFGVKYIQGLQGDSLKNGVIATGKHFIGHSMSQGGLNCAPVQMGKRTLWDVCLLPFQAAIRDAKIASIMNSYPELDGEVVAASRAILTDLLRRELGFEGLIVSDYEAVSMLYTFHKVTPDKTKAAILALEAGIQVELPTVQCYTELLAEAVEAGEIKMDVIDAAVSGHLQKKFELGLFENPYVDEGKVLEIYETPGQRDLASQIAHKSMVLLTNNGVLPLSKSIRTLAVIGPNADDCRCLAGDYTYPAMKELQIFQKPENSSFIDVDPTMPCDGLVKFPTVLDSIRTKLPAANVLYARGCDVTSRDTAGFDQALDITRQADAAVLVLGDKSGLIENCTCGETRDSSDLKLSGVQADLAKAVIALGKPVVVVLISGRPLAIPEITESASAVLEAWIPGEEGGSAVADTLFGDYNPGGKLAITIPHSVGQVPIFYNHKPSGSSSLWYTNYVNETVKPLFPFGHGLSYTQFEYADLKISKSTASANEVVDISCSVTNVGQAAGDEVVQLYIQDEYASLPRPVKELKGFKRITLQPGQKETLVFHLPVNILAFYDADLKLAVEAGTISIMLGSSSADIRLNGQFEIVGAEKQWVKDRVYICPVDVK
jgi:beta-glucosidase